MMIVGISMAIAAWSIAVLPVEDWDEARRGINAFHMLCSGDYWNYSFLGETDTFNTKPPLFVWLLALSFKWFGVGVWQLRLPSLIALGAQLFYLLWWLTANRGLRLSLLTVGAVIAVNGIIGYHVALSGDTDMLFVLCLTVFCLESFLYLETGHTTRGIVAVIALGAAFLTKGVAVALIIPGVLVYVFLDVRMQHRRGVGSWLILGLIGGSIGALILAVLTKFGTNLSEVNGYSNLLEAMVRKDGVQRFSDPTFEPDTASGYLLRALDIRFGILIYWLYIALVWLLLRHGPREFFLRLTQDRFGCFSCLIVISVLGLLQLSSNRHDWYVAPAVPFLAYLFARSLDVLVISRRWKIAIMGALLLIATGERVRRNLSVHRPALPESFTADFVGLDTLFVDRHMEQSAIFQILVESQLADRCGALRMLTPGQDDLDCLEVRGFQACRRVGEIE